MENSTSTLETRKSPRNSLQFVDKQAATSVPNIYSTPPAVQRKPSGDNVHTGRKPYKCRTCRQTFNTISVLKTHTCNLQQGQMSSSEDSKEMGASVPTPNPLVEQDQNVTTSKRVRFSDNTCTKCVKCDKVFRHKWLLLSHRKLAHSPVVESMTGEKCRVCGKHFKQKWRLKSHTSIAHSKKPGVHVTSHKCRVCHKLFTEKWRLKSHLRIVHSK